MKRVLNQYKITALSVLLTAILLAVVRVAVLAKNVEISAESPETHYLIRVGTATVVFAIISAIVVAVIIAWCISMRSHRVSVFEPLVPGTSVELSVYPSTLLFASALCGFMLLSSGIYFVYLFMTDSSVSLFVFILAVLMILASSGYLYSSFIAKGKTTPSYSVWFKIAPVFMAIYWLMYEFIEQNKYAINSSAVYHIMGLVCLMLFLTYDASNVRGAVRTVRYFATALLSVFLLIIDALPHMLLSCFWMLKLDMFVLLDAIAIVFALYAFSKIFTAVDISSEPDVSEKNSDTL